MRCSSFAATSAARTCSKRAVAPGRSRVAHARCIRHRGTSPAALRTPARPGKHRCTWDTAPTCGPAHEGARDAGRDVANVGWSSRRHHGSLRSARPGPLRPRPRARLPRPRRAGCAPWLHSLRSHRHGAGCGIRTHTSFRTVVFETTAYAVPPTRLGISNLPDRPGPTAPG